MTNFGFLKDKSEYALFAYSAIEAEKVFYSSPSMCAVGCRKALELAVKWVYSADNTIDMPYRENLQSLIHEPTFRFAVDYNTWGKLLLIVRLGNLAVHTERNISPSDAISALRGLFEFVEWIDYCYGTDYEERKFDVNAIPKQKVVVNTEKIKQQESLLEEKDAEIERLRKQIEAMSKSFTESKEENKNSRNFEAKDISEFETRKKFIDIDLKFLGWIFDGVNKDVFEEYPVDDMAGNVGQKGYVDYVLFGKDGLPLAVIEAKRSSKDPNIGRTQAVLYADALEKRFGRRPMIFTTNGFDTYFWDDTDSPQRKVSGVFGKDDLQKLMNRREEKRNLDSVVINDKITDRYYQKEAIRAVCDNFSSGFRKSLLVMATGTGKTRTASSLTDVLSRGGYVTNILFLADRTALVKQAKDDFKNYLPDMSLCNLCSNKDDRNARIVFSTYPTMLNSIDSVRNSDGFPLYTPAHFDLIIIDESHRSIFKKYKTIFEYFDALLVGLTATPKTDVDRNTYDFFEMEHGVPTYAYDYETAVYRDHVLVPYYNYEVKTKFIEEGITYDDLSDKDKERYEEDFAEDDHIPEFIPSSKLNKFVFNESTVDTVIEDLMERGIKVEGGNTIGKTIIFAQNKNHAEYILQRFNKLYPHLKGKFAQRVICDDAYAQTVIDDFKKENSEPYIAVSVDMMDTGIDVPECVNLVFFKKVRSKTKFWQMIGRGTRLAPDLTCIDTIDGEYTGKQRFLIFDYCGNFEYFRESPNGFESKEVKSLAESIFCKEIGIVAALQSSDFIGDDYQEMRTEHVKRCYERIAKLNNLLLAVRLNRKYVEKYKDEKLFGCINESDKSELEKFIAPLVFYEEKDEYALRFDNFMFGLMLSNIEKMPRFKVCKKILCDVASKLEKLSTIPQVREKLDIIKSINTDEFWDANNILEFEKVRKEIRGLLKFLVGGKEKPPIITNLFDPVIDTSEGEKLDPAYNFEDYRKKVNRYIEENGNTLAIHKLKNNIPLSEGDYKELERVLTNELGSKEDYEREFGDTPFGLLIRKIAKLDHAAAMEAFSKFINDESLNQKQIAFLNKIINHVEQNGYMEDVADLMKPPFDKPISFVKMFDKDTRTEIVGVINEIKDNAVKVIA